MKNFDESNHIEGYCSWHDLHPRPHKCVDICPYVTGYIPSLEQLGEFLEKQK